jgi:hypothetical protein
MCMSEEKLLMEESWRRCEEMDGRRGVGDDDVRCGIVSTVGAGPRAMEGAMDGQWGDGQSRAVAAV